MSSQIINDITTYSTIVVNMGSIVGGIYGAFKISEQVFKKKIPIVLLKKNPYFCNPLIASTKY
jgi:hypothetical protein